MDAVGPALSSIGSSGAGAGVATLPATSAMMPDSSLMAGYSMDVPGGATGWAGAGQFSPGMAKSPGLIESLGALMKNPEVAKAVFDTAGQFAKGMQKAQAIPPEGQQMIQAAVQQHQQAQAQNDQMNPYMGDISRFFTPQMAQQVLDGMGIPYGRMRF